MGVNTPLDYAYGDRVRLCGATNPEQMTAMVFAVAGAGATENRDCVAVGTRAEFEQLMGKASATG